MKILQVNKFLYPFGGAESYMFQLSDALGELGHEVEFWGMADPKNTVADTYGSFTTNIDYHESGALEKVMAVSRTIYSRESRKKIGVVLDAFKPDLVHIHNYNFQLTPSILPAIKKRGIPVVHTCHDSQMVCPYHRLYNFQQARVCTDCVEGSFMSCVRNKCFDGSVVRSAIAATESMYYHSKGYYDKYLDVIISPSQFLADLVSKRVKTPIEVIPNFIADPETGPGQGKEYVLYFGRVSEEKGISSYYSIFEEQKIPLHIVGTGPDVERIVESEYVKLLGPMYGSELHAYIAGARLVVQPAKWYENCPMTVIESFANGTPVVAADHSGFRALIQDGDNGFLLDFDQQDIGSKVSKIYADLADKPMTQACLETFHTKYTKQIHMEQIMKTYESVKHG